MTIAEVLHALIARLPHWDGVDDMHAAVDDHYGVKPAAAEPAPADPPGDASTADSSSGEGAPKTA